MISEHSALAMMTILPAITDSVLAIRYKVNIILVFIDNNRGPSEDVKQENVTTPGLM